MTKIRLIAEKHICHYGANTSEEELKKGYSMLDCKTREYVMKNGYHFTEALAEEESAKMQNADGQAHSWSAANIRRMLSAEGLAIPSKITLGDITYLANMAYADFYPAVLDSEKACLKYALAIANDPDGYEGQAFCRYLLADKLFKK